MASLEIPDAAPDERFYAALPALHSFADVADPACYHPVPASWLIVTTDIAGSTEAVAQGRYKTVNTAGAAAISAVANVLGHRDFPFVFGGDGASFAVPAGRSQEVAGALSAVTTWVSEELGLVLRAAIVPAGELRQAGRDVRVARYSPAPGVSYAMFDGGGLALAEARMKQGHNLVAPAPPGSRPDLSGLSCRWRPLTARNGRIVSLLVAPYPQAQSADAFMQTVREVLQIVGAGDADTRPVPDEGPRLSWPPSGLAIEAAAAPPGWARAARRAAILFEQALGWYSDRTGMSLGTFSGRRYRRETAANSDFRKFDDGLKLTLDLPGPTLDRLRNRLDEAETGGLCLYGLHLQDEALMTCIVPSPTASDHIHFIDGAGGGYVEAARMLKGKLAETCSIPSAAQ